MILQLLVDDNADIRYEVCMMIFRMSFRMTICISDDLECIEKTLSAFFQSFSYTFADKYPEIAISALFCWSVSLLGDADYEMDETDVSDQ